MFQWFKLLAGPEIPAQKQEHIEQYKQTKLRKMQDVDYLDDNDDVIMDNIGPVKNENDGAILQDDEANVTMPEVLMVDNSKEAQSDDEFELIDWASGIN
jgi:hypothetical protein